MHPKSSNTSAVLSPEPDAPKQNHYQRYILTFAVTALIAGFAVGLVNVLIDPYGLFKIPTFKGINKEKPVKFKQDLLIKAAEVVRKKPDIIYLGGSRAQWGLSPSHPALSGKVYNLGLQGINMYEARRYFEHALVNQPKMKQVIIDLDESMFSEFVENRPDYRESRLSKRHIALSDLRDIVFSLDTLGISKDTFAANYKTPNRLSEEGMRVKPRVFVNGALALDPHAPASPEAAKRFKTGLKRRMNADDADNRYAQFRLSSEQLANLKMIVETAHQRGIDVKILISPEHATLHYAVNTRFGPELETWKRELSKIAPVWDFSGYNSITTEPITNQMEYYLDSSHFSQKTGGLILNRILSYQPETVPQDFGVLVTPENVDSHLANLRTQRQSWERKNPDLVRWLNQRLTEHRDRK